ncbi:DUF3073 domain-containing protein [Frankia sp. Mgl5]|uniref:DUF3073 domain-containing protein n=1 Tax=Parafrankia soli TaxID=2599596 RepID=A0A1S1Q0X9_9ACTN|nr:MULTISPECIES: DUF3073 domain-containing protein [Frankiaceae]ABW16527.1 conserved hypothetical protein [Frankia sp. EAN1pec]CAI7980183.1 conserved hypothetical protein [Frankia sp. Hr75.2]MCK9930988.1 DUF3073 domain-containing protein [Frankia sp. Mgl5]OHV27171.1 hypothetical protein BBK14_04600 [Parafrankia soli]TCJ35484.1 DUF3073 domain-containing protein [Parafrankia sp. BMG5.11]
MGRGRAKAKQTKVARELKYNSPTMDLDRLKADLGAGTTRETESDEPYSDDDYGYDAYLDDEDEHRSSR